MNEKQLQHECVKWFSQTYPDKRGQLFAVNNNSDGKQHASALKAIGVVRGISDLILLDGGMTLGIEIKLIGSIHNADHIREQYNWGKVLRRNEDDWVIVRSLEGFKKAVIWLPHKDVLTLEQVGEMLDKGAKTIKF